MSRLFLLLIIMLAPSALGGAAARAQSAQPPSPKQKQKPRAAPEKASPEKASKAVAVDPAEEARRTTAVLLLKSLADDARDFRDPVLRARVQMQAADGLWEWERVRARTLFRRAWDAAVAADREGERRRAENADEQPSARVGAAQGDIPNLKAEVLRLASRRDPPLAEEFFKALEEERRRAAEEASDRSDAEGASSASGANSFEATAESKQRLSLAGEFMQAGDVARAAQLAAPALGRVTTDSIGFLSHLRANDAALADRHYATLLARTAADPRSDANTVSLLSSYVYTPGHFVLVMREGGAMTQSGNAFPAPELAPALRAAFFRTAAQVLLRPLPPPEQDRTSAGLYGTQVITARLLPLFERDAPEHAAVLSARLSNLTQELPEHRRLPQPSLLKSGLPPDLTAAAYPEMMEETVNDGSDGPYNTPEDVERAVTPHTPPEERDRIYVHGAMRLSGGGDARALELVEKVEDLSLRAQARDYIEFELASVAREKGGVDVALARASSDRMQPLKRVWIMTEVARALTSEGGKGEAARAVQILEDAAAVALRIEPGDPDRPRALTAVATRLFDLDRERVWVLLGEVVKSANSAEEFTGQDARLTWQIVGKNFSSVSGRGVSGFDLAGLFSRLAEEDLNRAAEFARGFAGEAPRAAASLALARAVLDKKAGATGR